MTDHEGGLVTDYPNQPPLPAATPWPPPPPPPPQRPPAARAHWSLFAVIGGAALAVLGSFLPWVDVTAPFIGSISVEGTEGDGKLTLALGLAILLGVIDQAAWRVVGLLAAVGVLGMALYDISDISNAIGDAGEVSDGLVSASVGIGLWAVLVGSLAAIVGIVIRSGWLERWGPRRYYALGAACVVALVLAFGLSDSEGGSSGIGTGGDVGTDLFDTLVSEDGGQLGLVDAGDADGDGVDDCIMFASEEAEYQACEDAGSDPVEVFDALHPGENYLSEELPTEDAGDQDGDGYDDCLEFASSDAEFDECEDAGSHPVAVAEAREAIGATDRQRPGEDE